MIDRYLAELRRELRGPWLTRASVLREVRDGLDDATEAFTEGGYDRVTARRRAIADFGTPGQVAASFNDEMAASAGRQTALLALVGTALGFVITDATWASPAHDAAGTGPSGGYAAIAVGTDVLALGTVIGAICAVLLLGSGTRWVKDSQRISRIVGWAVLGSLGVKTLAGMYLSAFAPVDLKHGISPWLIAGSAVMALIVAWMIHSAWTAISLSSRRRTWPQDPADDRTEAGPSFPIGG